MARTSEYQHTFALRAEDEAWGVVCTAVGCSSGGAQSEVQGSRFKVQDVQKVQEDYGLLYVAEGAGVFESDGCQRQRVESGTLMVVFPDERYRFAPDARTGCTLLYVFFRGREIEHKMALSPFHGSPVLSLGEDPTIADFFEQIRRAAEHDVPGTQVLVTGILMHLLGVIIYRHALAIRPPETELPFIEAAKTLMRKQIGGGNGGKNVSPEAIAAELGIGYTRFRRAFKERTGISPAQYQLELRFERAKQLLQDPEKSIGDISFELGFANQHQFSTFFRQRAGQAPTDWRAGVIGR